MPETLDIVLYRLAARGGQSGQVSLVSVSGRPDQWHATYHPGIRQRKREARGRTPVEAVLALESELDERGVP